MKELELGRRISFKNLILLMMLFALTLINCSKNELNEFDAQKNSSVSDSIHMPFRLADSIVVAKVMMLETINATKSYYYSTPLNIYLKRFKVLSILKGRYDYPEIHVDVFSCQTNLGKKGDTLILKLKLDKRESEQFNFLIFKEDFNGVYYIYKQEMIKN